PTRREKIWRPAKRAGSVPPSALTRALPARENEPAVAPLGASRRRVRGSRAKRDPLRLGGKPSNPPCDRLTGGIGTPGPPKGQNAKGTAGRKAPRTCDAGRQWRPAERGRLVRLWRTCRAREAREARGAKRPEQRAKRAVILSVVLFKWRLCGTRGALGRGQRVGGAESGGRGKLVLGDILM